MPDLKEKNTILSLAEASKITGYNQDYLGQLCLSGKLESQKIGRNWTTTKEALMKLSDVLAKELSAENETARKPSTPEPVKIRVVKPDAVVAQAPAADAVIARRVSDKVYSLPIALVRKTPVVLDARAVAQTARKMKSETRRSNAIASLALCAVILFGGVGYAYQKGISALFQKPVLTQNTPTASERLYDSSRYGKVGAGKSGSVLGNTISLPVINQNRTLVAKLDEDYIDRLILNNLNNAINAGWIAKPGDLQNGSAPSTQPQNSNQSYAPIYYVQPSTPSFPTGVSLLSATDLSSHNFITDNARVDSSLIVSGTTTLSGDVTITGVCTGCGDPLAIGTNIGSATSGSVLFAGAGGVLAQDNSNFFFDDLANALGIGSSAISSSAILQLTSTTKGFLAPRMTSAERDLIGTPATGLTIYNTSTSKYNYYDGSSWVAVASGVINTSLSAVTAATSDTSANHSANNIVWNWQLTGAEAGFTFGESAASTGGNSDQYILQASTLASSTATPLFVNNLGTGNSLVVADSASDTTPFVIGASGDVGIGITTISAKLHVLSATEQLRLGYDASNYAAFTVNSTGTLSVNSVGDGLIKLLYNGGNSAVLQFGTLGKIQSPSDGVLLLQNNAGSDFARINLGGNTSSFPAIKRSSTTVAFRLADDSADANISAAQGNFSDVVSAARYDVGSGWKFNSDALQMVSGVDFQWTSDSSNPSATKDTGFFRSSAGNVAFGNGDNGVTSYWGIGSAGILATTDNTYDIGASGATRPRTGYFGTSVVTPTLSASTSLTTPALYISGTTASDYLLRKGSAANLLVRSGNDSGFSNIGLGGFITSSDARFGGLQSDGSSGTTIIMARANNAAQGVLAVYGSGGHPQFALTSTANAENGWDVFLTRASAAKLQLGDVDAANPVAQTLSVQNVSSGTSNTAGSNFTIAGSQSTGTGVGGKIVFQTSPAGSSGSTQNALTTTMLLGPATVVNSSSKGYISLGDNVGSDGNTVTLGHVNSSGSAGLVISSSASTFGNLGFLSASTIDLGNTYGAHYLYMNWGSGTNNVTRMASGGSFGFSSSSNNVQDNGIDTILTRRAAANWNLGAVDSASPVAQTLSVQSVVAGTTNTAGSNFTISGSQSTGNASGGSILFQTSPAGSTGSSVNSLVTAMTILGNGNVGIGTTVPSNALHVESTTSPQLRVAYNSSNYFTAATSSAGAVTLDATGASAGFIFSDYISRPGSGSATELFGSGAVGTGDNNVVVGNSASAGSANPNNVVIGASATVTANQGNVVVGKSAVGGGGFDVVLGYLASIASSGSAGNILIGKSASINSTGTPTGNIFIGQAVTGGTNPQNSIAIGNTIDNSSGSYNVLLNGSVDVASLSNVFIAGNNTGPINNIYFGKGKTNAAPTAYTINGTGGTGTNIIGGDLQLAGGIATGNAVGGAILFKTSDAGGSGSSAQSLTTKVTIAAGGNVGIGTTGPGALLHIVADNATTNDVTDLQILQHTTTGTAAAGIGASQLFRTENASGTLKDVARIQSALSVATAGSETSTIEMKLLSTPLSSSLSTALKLDGNTYAVAVGLSASANGSLAIALGRGASAGGTSGFAVGFNASAAGNNTLALGAGSSVVSSSDNSFAIGQNSSIGASSSDSIAIGQSAVATGTGAIALGAFSSSTSSNQMVIGGGSSRHISSVYIGNGVTSTAPVSFILQGTGGSGTNIAGASVTLAGGKATGNAAGGDILFQTSDAGSTGTTLQSLTTKLIVKASGNVGVGTTTPGAKLEVAPAATTSGSRVYLKVSTAADTNMTASTESIAIDFNTAATRQFAAGALANQREVVFRAPTYAFTSASTITMASTVSITGPPVAGTNATITKGAALQIENGNIYLGNTSANQSAGILANGQAGWPDQLMFNLGSIDINLYNLNNAYRVSSDGLHIAPSIGILSSASGTPFAQDVGFQRDGAAGWQINNATAGQWGYLKVGTRDAGTNTVTNGLTIGHQSTGTPAAGLGSAILFNINSSTTADQNAAQIAALWTTATHASRTSALTFSTVNNAAALAEVMRIQGDGNVGIGTTTPGFQLEVVRGSAGVVARFTDSDGSCDIDPTSTALVCASDQNLKKDISTLQGTLAKLQNFRGVNFRWKTQDDSALRIGFIAQEVESVFPELVKTDSITGIKSVNYLGFAPVLVNAIKEQQTEIETIQNQLSSLQGSDAISGNTPVVIKSHIYLSKDSVGQAKILAGATSVRVSFEKPYEYQPIVTATANSRVGSEYWVADKDASGFTLYIENPSQADVTFDWHAFAGEGAKLTISDGTQSTITLMVTQPSAPQQTEPPTEVETMPEDQDEPVADESIAEPDPGQLNDAAPAQGDAASDDIIPQGSIVESNS